MKNSDKYTDTKSALKAWNKYHDGGGDLPFAEWAGQKVDPLTLLEAAEALTEKWFADGHCWDGKLADIGKKICALFDASERERSKPVRNFDRYKTAKSANDEFSRICSEHASCEDCQLFDKTMEKGGANCRFIWLYENADKDVDGK